jgi:hypothetical protein
LKPGTVRSHDLVFHFTWVTAKTVGRSAQAGTLEGLRAKVASGDWRAAVEKMADDWLQLDFVDELREDARNEARREVEASDGAPLPGEKAKQTESRKKKAMAEAEMRKRDICFENALLLMVQALLYTDYHDALRSGDTGRLEHSSDILCVMFQGLSKLKNYRALSLDFKACRVKEWTDEMRELWLLNSVVNLSGGKRKYLAIDEFNEWIVRSVKDLYNASGTIQSTKFTCEVISPNVIPLHHARHNVLRTSGAPTYGYKHTKPDDKRDIKAIVAQLLEEKVFRYTPGRDQSTDENLRATPSRDLYCGGVDAIHKGDVLEKYVKRKLAHIAGEVADDGEETGDSNVSQDSLFGEREVMWTMEDDWDEFVI